MNCVGRCPLLRPPLSACLPLHPCTDWQGGLSAGLSLCIDRGTAQRARPSLTSFLQSGFSTPIFNSKHTTMLHRPGSLPHIRSCPATHQPSAFHLNPAGWLQDGHLVRTLKGHGHWVNTLALSTEHALRSGAFDHHGKAPADANAAQQAALERCVSPCVWVL